MKAAANCVAELTEWIASHAEDGARLGRPHFMRDVLNETLRASSQLAEASRGRR